MIVNTAHDIRRWQYDFTAKGFSDLNEMKSRIISSVRNVPGTLSDPGPEVLVLELSDADPTWLKLRILWWTKAPRQHQMLTSYDAVLTAIWQTLSRTAGSQGTSGNRAA